MPGPAITLASTVTAATEQVFRDLDGEAVILNLKDGVYYGLDPVGTRIWTLIQKPRPVGEVRAAIVQEYAVESEQAERDVLALLEDLRSHGLIEITDAAER